jgi:uncharacterized surface protein with fasciclin (FAS1) repeats
MLNFINNKKVSLLFISIFAMLTIIACGSDEEMENETSNSAQMDEAVAEEVVVEEELISIAEIAVADGRFTTLVAALTAADLVETLSGDGTFTVFAPTDDAFAALPEGTLDGLLADTDALTQVLLYHVVGDVVMAEQVVEVSAATTLQGTYVSVKVDDGKVFINDAQVIITDLKANNGVIHVIDQVLIPNLD